MEVQLKEIIDRLKGEGIEQAQEQAQRIVEEGQAEAQRIIQEAEAQANRVRHHAEDDAARFAKSGTESVRHAARDLLLLVKKEIERTLTDILSSEVAQALSDEELQNCIVSFVGKWQPNQEYSVQLSSKDAEKISDSLLKKLQSQANKSTVQIKPFPELQAGFKISLQHGAVAFDFSHKEVAQLLGHLLNPRFVELLS